MMARALLVLGGMILGAAGAYCFFWTAGWAFGPLYASEGDMSRNVKFFLLSTGIGIALGGWLGNRAVNRYLLRR